VNTAGVPVLLDDVFSDDITLPAADGYPLAATLFLARGARCHAVLINSATATPRKSTVASRAFWRIAAARSSPTIIAASAAPGRSVAPSSRNRWPASKPRCRTHLRIPAARFARALQVNVPPRIEGAGKAGRSIAPAASRANEKSTRASHHRSAETIRPSLRNGVTAYSALSPVRPGLVVTVLAPASGRRDHTLLPSANHRRSSGDAIRVHRIPPRVS
jgi:hypothetical protein